jgi:hypothetical protein
LAHHPGKAPRLEAAHDGPRPRPDRPAASPDTLFLNSDYTLAGGDSLDVIGTPVIKVVVRQGA